MAWSGEVEEFHFYHKSAFDACRPHYCCTYCVCLSSADSVSKKMNISSHFFDTLVGASFCFLTPIVDIVQLRACAVLSVLVLARKTDRFND